MRKSVINEGDRFGLLTVIREVEPMIGKDGRAKRVFLFQCNCGKTKQVALFNVLNGQTQSCGCFQKTQAGRSARSHGDSKTRLYRLWRDIQNRCYNTNLVAYPDYGGRGITVFHEWIKNYVAFRDYVKTLDEWDRDDLTLDRIDNNGNYEPGNIRFVPQLIQSRNRRVNKQNKTNHRGITLEMMPSGNYRFRASIGNGHGAKIQIGSFKTIEDAVLARNKYITDHNLVGYEIEKL